VLLRGKWDGGSVWEMVAVVGAEEALLIAAVGGEQQGQQQ